MKRQVLYCALLALAIAGCKEKLSEPPVSEAVSALTEQEVEIGNALTNTTTIDDLVALYKKAANTKKEREVAEKLSQALLPKIEAAKNREDITAILRLAPSRTDARIAASRKELALIQAEAATKK